MALEDEVFRSGAVDYPLDGAFVSQTLKIVDPFVYHALAYYKFCLGKYMGERFLKAVTYANVGNVDATVGQTLGGLDPATVLSSGLQLKFPLLALHRKRASLSDRTIAYRTTTSAMELVYVLPPLTPAQLIIMSPFLKAAMNILDNRTEKGFDPEWTPNADEADTATTVWGPTVADMEAVEVKGASFGGYPGTGDLFFPAVIFDIEVKERSSVGDIDIAYDDFEGADLQADEQPATGAAFESVATDTVSFGLALSGITPSTGPIAGGTAVTLTGASFTNDCHVYIGGALASSITLVSSSVITCTSPLFDGFASTADVTVTNRNNQSATLEDGFTYTTV